eukprot:1209115-Prorocentrum_lima.AAC.1
MERPVALCRILQPSPPTVKSQPASRGSSPDTKGFRTVNTAPQDQWSKPVFYVKRDHLSPMI